VTRLGKQNQHLKHDKRSKITAWRYSVARVSQLSWRIACRYRSG
jgi:hypothetical protein